MSNGVILFHTTAMAMKAEKALNREGYQVTLVPTPRQFSSDCGIAVRFTAVSKEAVIEALEKNGVEVAGLHEL
jgi:pyridoxine 5'-phosphate synthase PdxJ